MGSDIQCSSDELTKLFENAFFNIIFASNLSILSISFMLDFKYFCDTHTCKTAASNILMNNMEMFAIALDCSKCN